MDGRRATSACNCRRYTGCVTRTYIAVVVVQVLVLAALWLLSMYFAP